MLVALSVAFIGIKKYRDQEPGGLGISLVASVIYVCAWEFYLAQTGYAFIYDCMASAIGAKREAGVSAAELESEIASLEAMRAQYAKPLYCAKSEVLPENS